MKIIGMYGCFALGMMMMSFNGLNAIQTIIATMLISMGTLLIEELV